MRVHRDLLFLLALDPPGWFENHWRGTDNTCNYPWTTRRTNQHDEEDDETDNRNPKPNGIRLANAITLVQAGRKEYGSAELRDFKWPLNF